MYPVIRYLRGESVRTADAVFTIQRLQPALTTLGQPRIPFAHEGDSLTTQGGRERLSSRQHAGHLTPDCATLSHVIFFNQVSGGVL